MPPGALLYLRWKTRVIGLCSGLTTLTSMVSFGALWSRAKAENPKRKVAKTAPVIVAVEYILMISFWRLGADGIVNSVGNVRARAVPSWAFLGNPCRSRSDQRQGRLCDLASDVRPESRVCRIRITGAPFAPRAQLSEPHSTTIFATFSDSGWDVIWDVILFASRDSVPRRFCDSRSPACLGRQRR